MAKPSIPRPRSSVEHTRIDRREFVRLSSLGALSLYFGTSATGDVIASVADGSANTTFAPNQWISIDQQRGVTIRAHKSEMGQGVRTALPAIVAAELGADWSRVHVVHAEPGPAFTDMGTSGSGSVIDSWLDLRRAAAGARVVLIRAAARRWRVDEAECAATDGHVVHTPSKRRLKFEALVADAARIPVPREPALRPDAELSLLGQRLKRVDTPAIVRGRAVYGIDARVAGMVFAAIERPPHPTDRLTHYDEAAARATAGVTRVVQVASGIAVIATNTWAALQGRRALNATWSSTQSHADATSENFLRALESALPNGRVSRREGDVDALMRSASRTMQATYSAPFQAHAALEPLNALVDPRDGRCEIWAGTQRPNQVKALAAKMLGIAEDRVTVHIMLMGGAFGRRIAIDHVREAIEVAQAINGPVQVVWSREDDLAHDMYQAAQMNRMTAGLDDVGNIVAWRHEVADYHLSMFGSYDPKYNPAAEGDPWGGFDTPYRFPALDVTLSLLEAPVPTGAWRSVTYPAAVFARECFLDEVAHATNRDPLALRLSLIPSPGSYGRLNRPNGDRLRNVLRLAAERAGWSAPLATEQGGRRHGRGIACNEYHRGAVVAQIAHVSVGDANDIRVHRVVTAIDVGRVIDRSGLEAQVEGGVGWALSAALKTEITFADGRAEQSNYNNFPVLRMREMPAQDVVVVESELGPFGAGEPPVPAVFAAVGNAVFAATGRRLRQTPLRL
ncbi:MAG TPA: molybdopterin cofactor-binding domain-containing protein [Gemmatimonadaceae bacterium]